MVAGVHVVIHLLDNHNTSSQCVRLGAVVPPSSCLGGGPHGWVPVYTHNYTRAQFDWGGWGVAKATFTSPIHHKNTRNSHMVAEQEFRTTTQRTNQPASSAVRPLAQVMVAAEQMPRQAAAQQSSRSPPVLRTP